LFFHVSNAYLDLGPVIGNVAHQLHMEGCELNLADSVRYEVISPDPIVIQDLIAFATREGGMFSHTTVSKLRTSPQLPLWTDDYSNLFSVLKLRN